MSLDMRTDMILMDRVVYKVIDWCLVNKTIVLWSDTKTTRIPMFYVTCPKMRRALNIKFLHGDGL